MNGGSNAIIDSRVAADFTWFTKLFKLAGLFMPTTRVGCSTGADKKPSLQACTASPECACRHVRCIVFWYCTAQQHALR